MNQPTKLIKVLFIDPYKKELRKVELSRDLHTWHQALRCDCVDCQQLSTADGYQLDIWFDDEFLCKEPVPPGFALGNGNQYAGYAFLAASNDEGDTISLADVALEIPYPVLGQMLGLRFEPYEQRLGKDACVDERMRTPEIEMPGCFRFLDICPNCGKVHS